MFVCLFHADYCVFVDAEHALDKTLAESIGVNTENLLLSQPDCGEQALSLVDTLIRSGSVDVIVVDSVSEELSFLVLSSSVIGNCKCCHCNLLMIILVVVIISLSVIGIHQTSG